MGTNLILIAAGIVLIFLIFRFVAKTVFRVILLILLLGGLAYVIWNWQENTLPETDKQILIYQLEEKYCQQQNKEAVCECIIQPVIKELESQYSDEKLKEMQKKDIKAMGAVLKILKDNRKEMKACLKEKDALDQWEQFKKDLKDQNFPEKLDKLFQ